MKKINVYLRKFLLSTSLLIAGVCGTLETCLGTLCSFCKQLHSENEFCLEKWYEFFHFSSGGYRLENEKYNQTLECFEKLSPENQLLYLRLLTNFHAFILDPDKSLVENFKTARMQAYKYNQNGCYYITVLGFIYTMMYTEESRFNAIITILKDKEKRRKLLNNHENLEYLHASSNTLAYCLFDSFKDDEIINRVIGQLKSLRMFFDQNPKNNLLLTPCAHFFNSSKTNKKDLLPMVLDSLIKAGDVQKITIFTIFKGRIPADLVSIEEVSKFVLGNLSNKGGSFLYALFWGVLDDESSYIDPTLHEEFWDNLRTLMELGGQLTADGKRALKKQILEFLLKHPKLYAKIWSVLKAPLYDHFLSLVQTGKFILDENKNPIITYNPLSVQFKGFASILEGNRMASFPIIIDCEGKFYNGDEEILVDSLGFPYLKDQTRYIEEKSKWMLINNPYISGEFYSNGPATASYLITILCLRNFLENFVDLFINNLERLKLPKSVFSFFFFNEQQVLPRFLACCQEIKDPILAGNFGDVFFGILRSDKFDPNDPQNLIYFLLNCKDEEVLHLLLEILKLYIADPDFSNRQIQTVLQQIPNLLTQCSKIGEGLLENMFSKSLRKDPSIGLELLALISNIFSQRGDYLSGIREILVAHDEPLLCLELLRFFAKNEADRNYLKNTIIPALQLNGKERDENIMGLLALFLEFSFEDYTNEEIINLFNGPVSAIIDVGLEFLCPTLFELHMELGKSIEAVIADFKAEKLHLTKEEMGLIENDIEIFEAHNPHFKALENLYKRHPDIFRLLAMVFIYDFQNASTIFYDILFP